MKRPCLNCGVPVAGAPRCQGCRTQWNRDRAARAAQRRGNKPRPYDTDGWRTHSRALRQQWVASNGWVCPGWQAPPHTALDLVVDHDAGILCRSCNATKAATHDKQRANQPKG